MPLSIWAAILRLRSSSAVNTEAPSLSSARVTTEGSHTADYIERRRSIRHSNNDTRRSSPVEVAAVVHKRGHRRTGPEAARTHKHGAMAHNRKVPARRHSRHRRNGGDPRLATMSAGQASRFSQHPI